MVIFAKTMGLNLIYHFGTIPGLADKRYIYMLPTQESGKGGGPFLALFPPGSPPGLHVFHSVSLPAPAASGTVPVW